MSLADFTAFTRSYLLCTRERSRDPFLRKVMLSLLHQYYDPLRLPSRSAPFRLLTYRVALYGLKNRAGEGLPSSRHDFHYMPIPLHRRVLPRCVSKCFTRSLAFARSAGARLSLVPYGVNLTMRQDSLLHVTACSFASQGFNRKISSPSCLLATEQLGLYSDRTFTD